MNTTLTLLITAVLVAATLRHIYRGGTTLNDHLVALIVSGCIFVYPILWWGAQQAALPQTTRMVLAPILLLGACLIYGLFVLLDRPPPYGTLTMRIGWLTQLAYAFSLWAGLVGVLWMPVAATMAWPLFWPGHWLWIAVVLAVWGTAWTWLHQGHVNHHVLDGCDAPFRLIQLSDLHASAVMNGTALQALVDRVNDLNPDAVAVTGDLVMPFSEAHHGYLLDALSALQAPVFCCLGNHDLPIKEALIAELEARGIRMLVDESTSLHRPQGDIEFAGLDFRWRNAEAACHEALAAMPPSPVAYRVLLAHDPRYFRWIPEQRFDLMLSGHTHGGQVGTNMFGFPRSVLGAMGLWDQGFFQRGPLRMYVHCGNWHIGFPPRMGIATEIAVFDIGAPQVSGSAPR